MHVWPMFLPCRPASSLSASTTIASFRSHLPPQNQSRLISDVVPSQMPDDIAYLSLLKEARLYNNQIAAVFTCSFTIASKPVFASHSVGSVRVLRMINNHVTTPLLNTIATGCPLIEELALSHNRVSQLQGTVCALGKLQRLLLHSNRISDISPEIRNMTSLETLVITENRLSRLPPELSQCSKLHVIRPLHRVFTLEI
jgi:Leucine-rich repeat (LRR) protein